MAAPKAKRGKPRGSFRVIAGRWRGRRLGFLDDGSVRPTPDRIRETLFNWLADDLHEARCVDLFAGSGALGIEALSRGASHLTFVDKQRRALAAIQQNLDRLEAQAECHAVSAEDFLRCSQQQFDIAFLDPPYAQGLVEPILQALAPRLAVYNRVYVECEAGLQPPQPQGWERLKSKQAGQVGYHLFSYSPAAELQPKDQHHE